MDKLKDLDEVAYVRFASVYREFKDVNTFMDEIKKILKKQQILKSNKCLRTAERLIRKVVITDV